MLNATQNYPRLARAAGPCVYTPEMGEARPADAVIDARLSLYGKHYFLTTPLTLKGRGIQFMHSLTPSMLVPAAQHKVGWNEYKVTIQAFEKICDQHKVACEHLLD